jgi:ABC-type glycerol-3-phosphate transport system substrate-binding protein
MADVTTRRDFLRQGTVAGLTVGSLGALVGACGGSDEPAGGDAAGAPQGSIRYIKAPNVDEDAAIQKQLAAQFHRAEPGITVKSSIYDIANAETELTTAFAGNDPADITQMQNTTWPEFAAAGALVDLTDRVKDAAFASEYSKYPEEAWDGLTLDGRIYGVPMLGGSISTLWANLDLMEKAGVTDWSSSFDAIRDAANRTRGGDVFGYGMTTTLPGYAYQGWINYVYNAGGNLLNEDATASGLDTPDVAAAFDFLRTLHFDDKVTPPPGAYDFPGLAALFQAGRLAILHLDGTVGYVTGLGTPEAVKFGVEPFRLPAGPGGQFTPVFRASLHVASKSDSPDAAWEYVKHLTSADVTADYLGRTSLEPVRTDVTERVFSGDDRVAELRREIFETTSEAGRVFPPHPQTLEMLEAVQDEFEQLIRGKQTGAGLVDSASGSISTILG